jgi:hypothetical protein
VVPADAAREVWASALCAQVDPELFFPEKGESAASAVAIRDLLLERNKTQAAGNPFLLQITDQSCGEEPDVTLASLADSFGS